MMPWVKLDEAFPEHHKITAAGGDAGWLFVCALAYCNRNLTNGFIPDGIVGRLSDRRRPAELVRKLVGVGLLEPVKGGWQIHDYLEYQTSRAKVEEERAKARDRMARIRGSSPEHSESVRPNNPRSSPRGSPYPIPIPIPIPIPSSSSSSTESGKGPSANGDEDDDRIVHAIEIHAAWAARSADNPRSYGRTVTINDRRDSVPDLQRYVQNHPSATAQTLARAVFSMSETDVHSYDPRNSK
jgi:hypothetical protein